MAPHPQTPQKAGQTTSGQAAGSTAIPFKAQRLSHGAAAPVHIPAAVDMLAVWREGFGEEDD